MTPSAAAATPIPAIRFARFRFGTVATVLVIHFEVTKCKTFFSQFYPRLGYSFRVPRKFKMNTGEIDVCKRLEKFRRSTGLSRVAFAKMTTLSVAQLANYERGMARLNYPAARQVLKSFPFLNPEWLALGRGDMLHSFPSDCPAPSAIECGARTPFSFVFERFLRDQLSNSQRDWAKLDEAGPLKATVFFTGEFSPDASGRVAALHQMQKVMERMICIVPDKNLNSFLHSVVDYANSLLSKSSQDKTTVVISRSLEFKELRARASAFLAASEHKNQLRLDTLHAFVNSGDVKAQWPLLKKRLQKATEPAGFKSKLAEFLGVKLASVSQWLSESDSQREPGAETTLQLLKWVELQERQSK